MNHQQQQQQAGEYIYIYINDVQKRGRFHLTSDSEKKKKDGKKMK